MASGCHGDHSEKVALLEQRGQLSQDMSSLHLAVTQLERDVTCLRADIRAVGKGMLISANCGANILCEKINGLAHDTRQFQLGARPQ